MILLWKNTNAFLRHLEDMKFFRRSHPQPIPGEPADTALSTQIPSEINPSRLLTFMPGFTNAEGKTIVVNIWDITMAEGSQN
jgi:hypothetical protein